MKPLSPHNRQVSDAPVVLGAEAAQAFAAAAQVCDPEIPVLTIADLGILHDVQVDNAGLVTVTILPTYSGCPAMSVIGIDIEVALAKAGFDRVKIILSNAPAWSTDRMTDTAREKLRRYGVAPPKRGSGKRALFTTPDVSCPRCGSDDTARISEFGSTSCKAQWRCLRCREPFDYFKCI